MDANTKSILEVAEQIQEAKDDGKATGVNKSVTLRITLLPTGSFEFSIPQDAGLTFLLLKELELQLYAILRKVYTVKAGTILRV